MADSITYRDPKSGLEVAESDPKLQAILVAGGYVKVTAATPKPAAVVPAPSTIPEHVAANKAAEKAAPAPVEKPK